MLLCSICFLLLLVFFFHNMFLADAFWDPPFSSDFGFVRAFLFSLYLLAFFSRIKIGLVIELEVVG